MATVPEQTHTPGTDTVRAAVEDVFGDAVGRDILESEEFTTLAAQHNGSGDLSAVFESVMRLVGDSEEVVDHWRDDSAQPPPDLNDSAPPGAIVSPAPGCQPPVPFCGPGPAGWAPGYPYESSATYGGPAWMHGAASQPWPVAASTAPAFAPASIPPTAHFAPKGPPVCRHFLAGGCYRADCAFSHSPDDTLCKFFLAGYCTKGSACNFSHTIPDPTPAPPAASHDDEDAFPALGTAPPAKPAPAPAPAPSSVADFPSLGGKAVPMVAPPRVVRSKVPNRGFSVNDFPSLSEAQKMPAKGRQEEDGEPNDVPLAYALKLNELDLRFPWAGRAVVLAQLEKAEWDMLAASEGLEARFGRSPLKVTDPKPKAPTAPQWRAPKVKDDGTEIKASRESWLDTGVSVAKMYGDARATAIEYARIRNSYFDAATRAYLRGDGARAREMSRMGREYNDIMKAMHDQAKDQIFHLRNKSLGINTLDLHGLHLTEATTVLRQRIDAILGNPAVPNSLKVICGTGHHTKGGERHARLNKNIRAVLDEYGFEYHDVSTDSRGGMLQVRLARPGYKR